MRQLKDIRSRYAAEKKAHGKTRVPPDLRERQRQLAKEEILAAALKLFGEQGYSKTTMQAIADNASVGVATVFRNFGTKGAILAELVRKDLEEIFAAGWEIVLNPSHSLTDTINALVKTILGILDKPSKAIRTPTHLWPAVIVGKSEIDEVVRWADELTQIQIYAAFVEYKQRFDIEFPFNPADMAMNIFYIFNGHYAAFLAEGKNNTKQLENDLERRISIVLAPQLISSAKQPSRANRR